MFFQRMDVLEVALVFILGIIGIGSMLIVYKYISNVSQKTRKNNIGKSVSDDTYKITLKEMQENYSLQIEQLKKDRYRLQGIVNRHRLNGKYDNDEDNKFNKKLVLTDYKIDKEVVRPFLSKWDIPVNMLDNPLLSNMLLDKFKGHEELMLSLGILRPKGSNSTTEESTSSKPAQTPAEKAMSNVNSWA